MCDQVVLFWIAPLVTAPFVWQAVGTAGSIRALTTLRDKEKRPIEYLNLVTAVAATHNMAFHSGEYHDAASRLKMPYPVANALIQAGDGILPETHKYFAALSRLVEFLSNGGNL